MTRRVKTLTRVKLSGGVPGIWGGGMQLTDPSLDLRFFAALLKSTEKRAFMTSPYMTPVHY